MSSVNAKMAGADIQRSVPFFQFGRSRSVACAVQFQRLNPVPADDNSVSSASVRTKAGSAKSKAKSTKISRPVRVVEKNLKSPQLAKLSPHKRAKIIDDYSFSPLVSAPHSADQLASSVSPQHSEIGAFFFDHELDPTDVGLLDFLDDADGLLAELPTFDIKRF